MEEKLTPVDNFIYPKNGETVTFMDNSVNTESFLNGLKDENQVNMDFGTQVLSIILLLCSCNGDA